MADSDIGRPFRRVTRLHTFPAQHTPESGPESGGMQAGRHHFSVARTGALKAWLPAAMPYVPGPGSTSAKKNPLRSIEVPG
jgi:hypothetical protein